MCGYHAVNVIFDILEHSEDVFIKIANFLCHHKASSTTKQKVDKQYLN